MCYLGAQVVFKWQWFDWTRTHPAGNHHMTGQKIWPSNWLLFVISRVKWASGETIWQYQLPHMKKPTTSVAPHHLQPPPLCEKLSKMVGNSAIAVLCRIGQLKDIV